MWVGHLSVSFTSLQTLSTQLVVRPVTKRKSASLFQWVAQGVPVSLCLSLFPFSAPTSGGRNTWFVLYTAQLLSFQ